MSESEASLVWTVNSKSTWWDSISKKKWVWRNWELQSFSTFAFAADRPWSPRGFGWVCSVPGVVFTTYPTDVLRRLHLQCDSYSCCVWFHLLHASCKSTLELCSRTQTPESNAWLLFVAVPLTTLGNSIMPQFPHLYRGRMIVSISKYQMNWYM